MNQSSSYHSHSIFRKLMGFIWLLAFTIVFVPDAMAQGKQEVKKYLSKLDINRNEILEPGEINDRARGFLQTMEFDTSRPIPIKRILRKVGKSNEEESEKDKTPVVNSSTRVTKVPGFGHSDDARPVAAFGLSEVEPATTRFSESVLNQVEETLQGYDLNKDRILDKSEIKRANWGKPEPSKSDTNRDGKLTFTELANRYYAREQFSRESAKTNIAREKKRQVTQRANQIMERSNRNNRSNFNSQMTRNRNTAQAPFRRNNSTASKASAEERKKYAAYAKSLIENYDKDGDGNLSQTEVKSMRRPPAGADADGNGYVTETELVDSLSGANKSNAGKPQAGNVKSKAHVASNARARNSVQQARNNRGSASFGGLDKNGNNQVEMHEFASEWNDQKAEEYFKKDKNRDGVITSREWNSK